MTQKRRIYLYEIPTIPDCTHHRLITLCGGNVREHIFQACEHLVRMIANFQEEQLAMAIRFVFNPMITSGLQQRLTLQLAVKIGESVSEHTVGQLINSGPLAEFYEFKKPEKPQEVYNLDNHYPYICEVIRQEEKIKPLIPKEENPGRIPSVYYSLHPFEARTDNDYLMVDTLLSKIEHPCTIELLVRPVDQSQDLESQYKYITRLMSVNQYENSFSDSIQSTGLLSEESQPAHVTLTLNRKRDPMADDFAREHQELYQMLRQPQLLFHVKAFAMNKENALMLASAIAESAFCSGKYRLLAYGKDGPDNSSSWLDVSHEDSQSMNVSLQAMYHKMWDNEFRKGYRGMARLCRMASVDELKGLIRLPVGGYGSPRCIRKSTDPEANIDKNSILIGDDLESERPEERLFDKHLSDLSKVFCCSRPANLELQLPLQTFTKHMFVAGVPGSGKTTAVYNMLVQLFRHNKPFLVIEPVKTEYRILKTLQKHPDPSVRKLACQLRIYSPGNDTVSPFRFNPLSFPEGITLDEHIGQTLSCFEAAMPMGGPLQALIAEAVEEVYNGYDHDNFPQMEDLVEATRQVMQRKEYEGEIKSNLQAAIEVRLGMLTRRDMGRIFQCQNSIPSVEELLKYPTIIEMDYLSQDHACLLTLFLLSALREQIKTDPNRRRKDLHHVTVIEEAHNIVGRTSSAKASEEIADPKAFAAQYISRMLAELRALGEGIIIADQLPSTVAPEVVKNTGTKLAHRLVSNEDREDLGGAMLLGATEIEEIARLDPGEAYFYTEGLHRPRCVRCLNANEYLKLEGYIGTVSIVSIISKEDWFIENQTRRISTLRRYLIDALDEAQGIYRNIKRISEHLSDRYNEIIGTSQEQDTLLRQNYLKLKNESANFQNKLAQTLCDFDARFRIVDTFSENNKEVTEGIELLITRWQETVRPNLVKLKEDLYLIESQVSLPKLFSSMQGEAN